MDDPGHIPCSVMVGSDTCLHPAGLGGSFPFSISGVCEYPIHRVMVNWDPPNPAGWRQVPDPTMTEHGICPGPSICYIYSGIK